MGHQDESLSAPRWYNVFVVLGVGVMYMFGKIRDLCFWRRASTKQGYAPVSDDYNDFFNRRMYRRIHDLWNRPISSAPGPWVDVMERTGRSMASTHMALTGRTSRCLNLGSYNYLGFAAADEYCTPRVLDTLDAWGVSTCSTRVDSGSTALHRELEEAVAAFLGMEDAITYGMGFATNSASIPLLAGKGCLVLSDALNHASIVAGVKGSGVTVRVFRHNDVGHLEKLLRLSIAQGQPRTRRPWRKVLIMVEGIYSMEGEPCPLAAIVELKKRYKAYLYLDEAHSIGALGATGRGLCEQAGVDPSDVDVLMGTFTKSFGSCGGYVAGSRQLVDYMRRHSPAHLYATSMAPGTVQQVISALQVIQGVDGSGRGVGKIRQLHDNANYFRRRLQEMGLHVMGAHDSPVMPILVYHATAMPAVSRMCLERGVALVMVAFPATPLLLARARVCISAAHTRDDLDYALEVIDGASKLMGVQFERRLGSHKGGSAASSGDEPHGMAKAASLVVKAVAC